MDTLEVLIKSVADQNSPNNNLRMESELKFNKIATDNPSSTAHGLMYSCLNDETFPIDIRQSCLLHLKRLVPKFWSMGFQSFVGPPIDQDTKTFIRKSLIQLATQSTSSKIRSGSAYVIVQIAASDFPDEWPDLLDLLYNCATDNRSSISVIGSIAVLNDLFDDLINEMQFWEGGVGERLISYIVYLLEEEQVPADVKISGLKLYLTIFDTLSSAEALESEARRTSVLNHIRFINQVLISLVKQSIDFTMEQESIEMLQFSLRTSLYQVLTRIFGNFRKQITVSQINILVELMNDDLSLSSRNFRAVLVSQSVMVPTVEYGNQICSKESISDHLISIFELLSIVQGFCPISGVLSLEKLSRFYSSLITCAQYPKDTSDEYLADFNVFVTDLSGLSSQSTMRDSMQVFIEDLNKDDVIAIYEYVNRQQHDSGINWIEAEAVLFLKECLYSNANLTFKQDNIFPEADFSKLTSMISLEVAQNSHVLLVARIFQVIPRVLDALHNSNFDNNIEIRELQRIYQHIINLPCDNYKLIYASALVGAAALRNIKSFKISSLGVQMQTCILKICELLFEESEEDTLSVLLEAISLAINMDRLSVFSSTGEDCDHVSNLILSISFKDPANVQVSINSTECMQSLLKDINMTNFSQICQYSLSFLIGIMKEELTREYIEYSSRLYLSLDFLGCIIEAHPCPELPKNVFVHTLPVVKDLILKTNDDQILQNAGEVFNKLMQGNEKLFIEYSDGLSGQTGLDILLSIASKFLSPELSDTAAMNSGLIVITLFERFQECLDCDFFFQLLEATVRRLAISQGVITIENLIMVFCKLVLESSPNLLIDALIRMEVKDALGITRDGLKTVLPIWFDSFEVTRGAAKIHQNILALGRIFMLGDPRVESVWVDGDLVPYEGDLIITRSKAKTMPQKFTQVSAPQKILKLLVSELDFQSSQPDPDDYVHDSNSVKEDDDDDDDDEWEDMEGLGVPNFEKLKSYVDSDVEDKYQTSDKGIRDTLIQFFKECITSNLADFQTYYETLDDNEKTVISKNVIFA